MVSTFVNNIKVMTSKRSGIIYCIKIKLTAAFLIVDMGPISFYLRLKVEKNRENQIIKLLQSAYINQVFSKFHLDKANTVNTLIKKIIHLQPKSKGKNKAIAAEKKSYQLMTGSIMFSMVEIRLNISFAILIAS